MAFELDVPAALKVGPVKLTKPRVTLRPLPNSPFPARRRKCLEIGATSPVSVTMVSAKVGSPPIRAVRHSRRGGQLRGQAPPELRLLGAVPHPNVLGRHP